jgi:two-component system, sensor histidine kinase and response regulator
MKFFFIHLLFALLLISPLESRAASSGNTDGGSIEHGQKIADEIASSVGSAFYGLDLDQVKDIATYALRTNNEVFALTIIDAFSKKTALTLSRQGDEVVYNQPLSDEFINLSHFKSPIIFDGETIGTVEVYYATSSAIDLSAEELAWIVDHPVISVGIEDWFPFVRLENDGTPGGIAGDFLKLVLEKTGLKIEVISDAWSPLLKDFENGKIDLLPATYYTDKRATYGLYSNPYFTAKEFLYVQQGNDTIQSFDDLDGKKLGIVEGYGTIPKIRQKFPGIKIVETKNQFASITAVLNGDVDALYESQIVIDDLARRELIVGLKAIGQTSFRASPLYYFSRIDEPLLQSILTKSLDSITEEERREVINKWVVQSHDSTIASEPTSEQTGTTWLFVSAILIFVALLITALLLPRYIAGEKLVDQFGSIRFRIIALVATSLMIVLVAGLVWRALDQNRNIALNTTRENLDVVLNNTMERLDLWVSERQKFLMSLGRDPELVEITKKLLALPIEAGVLKTSEAQKKIRRFFEENEAGFGKIGFFIISPNAISIGSGRDANLGTKNLIAEQKPELLAKAFEGEAVFIPPIRSDVVIGEQSDTASSKTKKPLTMFFAVPIRDLDGTILAVLTQRLLPEGQMSMIMQGGRTGHSGESYLVNVEGILVTQSRFKNELIDIGLLSAKGAGQEEVHVRDPGGNMLNGYKPKTSMSERPLTRMAESILEMGQNPPQTDIDTGHTKHIIDVTDSYRDYRGVPVFGAWVWDNYLGLGMASEVDVEEALAGYYSLRLSFLLITGITLVLTISALFGTLIIGERSTQVMRRARDELEDRVIERTGKLKEREGRLSSIIENATDGIITINTNAQIQSFSHAAEKIFGYSENEVIGQNVNMLMPEPYHGEHDGYLQNYYSTGERKVVGFNREVFGLRKDGSEFPMDLAVGESIVGELRWFTGIVRDITERKQVESELKKSEATQKTIFENIDQGILLTDADGNIVAANDRYAEVLGFGSNWRTLLKTYDDMVHYYYEVVRHEEKAEGLIENALSVFSSGKELIVERQIQEGRFVEIRQNPLESGGVVRTYTDITTRKQAEMELAAKEAQLRDILEGSPYGIAIVSNKTDKRTYTNPLFNKMFGRDENDSLVRQNSGEITASWVDPEDMNELRRNAIDHGWHFDEEVQRKNADGTQWWCQMSSRLIDYEGEAAHMVWHYDVTERKHAEDAIREARDAAEEATKAKATFLATMSHEIRTPMGGVIGMVDLLQQSKMTDDQRQMINTVGDSAQSLLTIINDILDFSKIEAGKLDLEEIPISICNVVEGAGEGLAISARNKNIGLSVYVDPDIPDALVGDQVRLRQILFNFGTNAIKFAEKGKVFLRADKIPSKDKGKATVRFQVIDEGIGIPKEAQAKLFQAFSQVDASTTRKFGGTGLGLTICQRLTEIMNGEIDVDSVPGEGSTFSATVTFPVAEEHTFKSDGHDLDGLKVLLAHKDDEMRELIPRYLEHWKAKVTTTSEIDNMMAMALDAAKDENPFDVIFVGSGWSIDTQADAVRSLQAEKTLSSARYVVAFRNRIKADRPEINNTVYVNAGPLKRADLIKSIAIAAGRASPEVEYNESELMLAPSKAPTVAKAEAAGQLILLAEDNLTNQDVIRRQLTMLGFAVEIANDGKEALELLETRNFSILMTDCHMPNMDGFELTEAIRQSEKDKDSRFPIVAVTASVMKEEIDHCFASGMDDYLAKPLEMAKLKDMLRKWMPVVEHDAAEATSEITAEDASDIPNGKDSDDGEIGAIDPSALKSVFGDDEETFKEILLDFVDPATSNISEIEAAFNDRSADGVARAAHKLKSSSRSVGAIELGDLCQALETAGNSEDWEEIDKSAPRLNGAMQEVTDYIKSL